MTHESHLHTRAAPLPPPPRSDGDEPDSKRQRTDFVLQPEDEFLERHPGAARIRVQVELSTFRFVANAACTISLGVVSSQLLLVTLSASTCLPMSWLFCVQAPDADDSDTLNGQILEVEVASLTDSIAALKARLAEVRWSRHCARSYAVHGVRKTACGSLCLCFQ